MKRTIVNIDEEKCNGCGLCVPNCHEGALQIIDNKAVLISDLMCDGLGACLGHCPEGALSIEEREAAPYDEIKVMEDMISKGKNVVTAHLMHLKEHGEFGYLKQVVAYLTQHPEKANFDVKEVIHTVHLMASKREKKAVASGMISSLIPPVHEEGCPGSQSRSFSRPSAIRPLSEDVSSSLTQWPVQMHLINPAASYFMDADLLIAADCVAFSVGDFHQKYLLGKKLAIACPKLDSNKDVYLSKITHLIEEAKVKTITVMIMEVPCCGGLLHLVLEALKASSRKIPVKTITAGIQGTIISEKEI